MKQTLTLLLIGTVFFSCGNKKSPMHYTTKSYVAIGRILDMIKPPYVIDVQHGDKRIVFIGCVHEADSIHPQFRAIGQYFKALRPQVAFNEGGQIPAGVHYATLHEAIKEDGETAVLKFYADRAGIKMLNGDLDARTEFVLTLRKQAKDDLYIYYVMERIVVPYHYGAYQHERFDKVFNRIIEKYFVKNGFPLTGNERSFDYWKGLYKRKMGSVFNLKNIDMEAFDFINDNCKFCAIGRTSKMVRDSMLLLKIDHALDTCNRVMITFGHAHAMAVEPALKEIVYRKRGVW